MTTTVQPYVSPPPCTCGGTVHDHLPGCPQTCTCGRGRGPWRTEQKHHKATCILRETDVRLFDDAVYANSRTLAQIDAIIRKHDEAIRLLRSLRVSTIDADVRERKAKAAALEEFKREVSGVHNPCAACAHEDREKARGVTFIADAMLHTCARGPRPVEPPPDPDPRDPHGYDF